MKPLRLVSSEGIRTEEVLPPSASGETRLVLRASAAIVFGALFVIGLHAGTVGPGGGPRAGDLAPFQVLFRDAPPAVQLMFRELQEGVREAENGRAADKRWPAVETLAAQGLFDDRPNQGRLPGKPAVDGLDRDSAGLGDRLDGRRGVPEGLELTPCSSDERLPQLLGLGPPSRSVVSPLDARHGPRPYSQN